MDCLKVIDRKVKSLSLSAENKIIGHQREHYQVFCGRKMKHVSLSDSLCLVCVLYAGKLFFKIELLFEIGVLGCKNYGGMWHFLYLFS